MTKLSQPGNISIKNIQALKSLFTESRLEVRINTENVTYSCESPFSSFSNGFYREIKSEVITLSINTMSGSIDKALTHAISIIFKLITALRASYAYSVFHGTNSWFEWYSLLSLLLLYY